MTEKEFYDLKLHGTKSRQRFLNNSDWTEIRKFETGQAVDQETADKRILARSEISLLRETTNPDDFNLIKHLTKTF